MKSLVGAVIFTMVLAATAVYAVAHRDALQRTLAEASQLRDVVSGQAPSSSTDGDTAGAEAADGAATANPYDVTLTANDQGHFETEAEINGRGVDVMVDTGATIVALTYEDAARAGIYLRPSDFTHEVSTANGAAKVAPVTIGSVTIGSITVRNVKGAVAESGKLQKTLLGMSFLGRLSRVDMRSKNLVLQE